MRLATLLLALALAAPLASAAPDLRVPDLAPDPDTDGMDCALVVPDNPGRGLVCAVEMAFCVTAQVFSRPCA